MNATNRYSHFVPIPTLRTSNSGIALRKVRIPTSPDKVRIPTLRRTIPELYRFSLCAEHIYSALGVNHSIRGKALKENQTRPEPPLWRVSRKRPPGDKTNKMTCAPSEDSNQAGHSTSLISLRCALNGYLRIQCFFLWTAKTLLWSDWADAQPDLSLLWALSRPRVKSHLRK